jgi:hypothetical protein
MVCDLPGTFFHRQAALDNNTANASAAKGRVSLPNKENIHAQNEKYRD